MQNFPVCARVRSYDFPGNAFCYVEGVVTGIVNDSYSIAVDHRVFDGKIVSFKPGCVVNPPLNGLKGIFGETCGVVWATDRYVL